MGKPKSFSFVLGGYDDRKGYDGSLAREAVSKITYQFSKLLAKVWIKLTQIPSRESYDPESSFKACKTLSTERLKEIRTILAPLYKVMPWGDRVVAIMDNISHQNSRHRL